MPGYETVFEDNKLHYDDIVDYDYAANATVELVDSIGTNTGALAKGNLMINNRPVCHGLGGKEEATVVCRMMG